MFAVASRATIILLGLCPILAQAADSEGRFMVKGGGRATCAQFLAAQQTQNNEFVSLAGWVDGYLSGLNQSEPGTFDIAPWQGVELLLAAIAGHCREHPEHSFHQAAFRMTEGLRPGRLIDRSELIEARVEDKSVVLYRATVQRIQERLKLRGLYNGAINQEYDAATIEAVKAFQTERKLPVTGLPDQLTLANLL